MKKLITDKIRATASCTEAEAGRTLDEVVKAITEVVRETGEARIQGFGTFRRHTNKAHQTTNPRTGEQMNVEARTVLKFRASKNLTV